MGAPSKQSNPRPEVFIPCLLRGPNLRAKGCTRSQVDSDEPILDLRGKLVELSHLVHQPLRHLAPRGSLSSQEIGRMVGDLSPHGDLPILDPLGREVTGNPIEGEGSYSLVE